MPLHVGIYDNYHYCLFSSARKASGEIKKIGEVAFIGCLVKLFYNVSAVLTVEVDQTLGRI